jgi:hypothetical protein
VPQSQLLILSYPSCLCCTALLPGGEVSLLLGMAPTVVGELPPLPRQLVFIIFIFCARNYAMRDDDVEKMNGRLDRLKEMADSLDYRHIIIF